MALELVGGALLSVSLQVLFERLASPELLAYLRRKCKSKGSDFNEVLGKFKSELNLVSAVLDDAEQKQTTSRGIEEWLDMLQELVFDAEDLLDEIKTDADVQLKVEAEPTASSSKVRKSKTKGTIRNFFSRCSRRSNSKDGDLESEIKMILQRLEHIAKQVPVLNLVKVTVRERPAWRPLASTSLVDESGVYGRDDDKKAITKLLLSDHAGNENVSVIPIVGMGGVGKTTLAQAVFNNDEVQKHFELKAWVCVSDDFDACRVIKALVQSLSPASSCDAMKELNLLQVKLKETLSDKKFLIVLDDIWNEKYDDWDNLRKPFVYGAQGSKIMVTTRSKEVASITGTVPTYDLKVLEEEACWQLFARHAFGNGGFNVDRNLQRIGRDIVKKCKGLPLAAKTLAGLLRSTRNVTKWKGISSNEIWELPDDRSNILPALRLSYHYLPSHLKRCFAYCSIFPKDYQFEKEILVLLWMAEDLLVHPKRDKRIEDVGNEYFDDLLCRSFFQRSGANESLFVLHDLMNDLAKFVSKKYCFRLENGSSDKVEKKTRHLACVMGQEGHDLCEGLKSSIEATRLRTFVQLGFFENVYSLFEIVLKWRYLRVLSFSWFRNRIELPDSIGELRHLRYLDLSHTSISRLPESFCMLYNLQTLKLKDCRELTEFPRDFHHLVNLRYLDVKRCDELKEMPKQMGNLKSLQRLSTFIVGKDNDTKIGQLGKLPDLNGRLHLKNLQNVVSAMDASEAKLRDKCLEELEFEWCSETGYSKELESGREALDNLIPGIALKKLNIRGYGDRRFPNWLGNQFFCNVVDIDLSNCKYCDTLPPLGQLSSLRCLKISSFAGVVRVGSEFYGKNSSSSFVSLEVLKFEGMSKWEEWSIPSDAAETFPKLKVLSIRSCEKLIGDLPCLLPSLKKFDIFNCAQIASSLPMMPEVNELCLVNCNRLIGVYNVVEKLVCHEDQLFCSIVDINLSNCEYCDRLPPLGQLSSLKRLRLERFNAVVRVGPEFYGITNSRSSFASLEILSFQYMLKWEEWSIPFDDAETFPKLRELSISFCENMSQSHC